MKVIDPGHLYQLSSLDGDNPDDLLRFVKREGEGYPGNVGHYPGTIIQDVLRAIIDRLDYVNNQIPCGDNRSARVACQTALWFLENRAAERHGRKFTTPIKDIEFAPTCEGCGHIGCPGCERISSSPQNGVST